MLISNCSSVQCMLSMRCGDDLTKHWATYLPCTPLQALMIFQYIYYQKTRLCSFSNRYLCSQQSCSFLTAVTSQGFHIIKVDTGFEEGHCGLVPVGLACKSCSTTGLVWNLGMFTWYYTNCTVLNWTLPWHRTQLNGNGKADQYMQLAAERCNGSHCWNQWSCIMDHVTHTG